MDAYALTAAAFHERINMIAGAVDRMAPGLESGAQQLVNSVIQDGKILVCTTGDDAFIGAHTAARIRQPAEGPALPALHLGNPELPVEGTTLWRDIRTLSRDGDVLLCIDSTDAAPTASATVQIAAERNLGTITLSQGQLPGAHIPLPADTQALRVELAMMAVHQLLKLSRMIMLGE